MAYRFKTGRVAVNSTTPVKILDGFEAPEGAKVTFLVTGENSVHVGDENVTFADGYNLSNLGMPVDLTSYGPADLYAITSINPSQVSYFIHQTEEIV